MKGLRTAAALARKALWMVARERWPKMLEDGNWEHGPDFMKCSFGELERSTNFWFTARELKEHLINFSRLRNFLAHPSAHSRLERYNSWFQDAERLVEKLGNEQLLRRIQKIRQGWRIEAKQTLAEIEARETLAELPWAYDGNGRMWKTKHELLFRRVRCFPERLRNDYFLATVVRAAETWARVCEPGLPDPLR